MTSEKTEKNHVMDDGRDLQDDLDAFIEALRELSVPETTPDNVGAIDDTVGFSEDEQEKEFLFNEETDIEKALRELDELLEEIGSTPPHASVPLPIRHNTGFSTYTSLNTESEEGLGSGFTPSLSSQPPRLISPINDGARPATYSPQMAQHGYPPYFAQPYNTQGLHPMHYPYGMYGYNAPPPFWGHEPRLEDMIQQAVRDAVQDAMEAQRIQPAVQQANQQRGENIREEALLNRLDKKEQKHRNKHDERKKSAHKRSDESKTVGNVSGTLGRTAFHYAPMAGGAAAGAAVGGVIGSGILPPVTTFVGIGIGAAVGGTGGKIAGDIGDAIFGGLVEKATSWSTSHIIDAPRKLLKLGLSKYSSRQAGKAVDAKETVQTLKEKYGDESLSQLKTTEQQLDHLKDAIKSYKDLDNARSMFKCQVLTDQMKTERPLTRYFEDEDHISNNPNDGLDDFNNLKAAIEICSSDSAVFGSLAKKASDVYAKEYKFEQKYALLNDAQKQKLDELATDCQNIHYMDSATRHQPLKEAWKEAREDGHATKLLQKRTENNRNPVYALLS